MGEEEGGEEEEEEEDMGESDGRRFAKKAAPRRWGSGPRNTSAVEPSRSLVGEPLPSRVQPRERRAVAPSAS